MKYVLDKLKIDGVQVQNPITLTVDRNLNVIGEYKQLLVKMVKIVNQTGQTIKAVKITYIETPLTILDGTSAEIPFDPAQGDVEIQIKPVT